ncbi:MAG: class I SAM-dependent methyltransferase [Byssovorax sp.]
MSDDLLDETRRSWNLATRAHNGHKRDQAAFLRGGGSTLFPEETELVGDVSGMRLLHLLCNSGQDSLSLAARGAIVTGVDLSDEPIAFARRLSDEAGIPAAFVQSEAQAFLDATEPGTFDVVFMSYGALIWIADISRLFRGIAAVLAPGGRVVVVDFHPLVWSFDEALHLKDPYFARGHVFSHPVSDYVGASGGALSPSGVAEPTGDEPAAYFNPHQAHSYQHPVGEQLTAMIEAGLSIAIVREYPYANGCRLNPALVEGEGRRFRTPEGVPDLPLMLGVVATAPGELR